MTIEYTPESGSGYYRSVDGRIVIQYEREHPRAKMYYWVTVDGETLRHAGGTLFSSVREAKAAAQDAVDAH